MVSSVYFKSKLLSLLLSTREKEISNMPREHLIKHLASANSPKINLKKLTSAKASQPPLQTALSNIKK